MTKRADITNADPGRPDFLVVGDTMVDQHFVVDRRDNLDEKVVARNSWRALGGTGANTAAALHALKLRAWIASTIGDDALGDEVLALLRQHNLDTSMIQRRPGVTGQAVILHDYDSRQVIVDRGVVDRARDDLPRDLPTYVTTPGAVVRMPELVGPLIVSVEHQMLDLGPSPLLDRADIVIVNEAGYKVLSGATKTLPPVVVETRGSAGVIVHADGRTHRIEPVSVQAVDPTGAGDAFAAGLLAAYRAGHDVCAAAARGNALAAYAVTQRGASLTNVPDELAHFVVEPG